jgi:hypothetical protein
MFGWMEQFQNALRKRSSFDKKISWCQNDIISIITEAGGTAAKIEFIVGRRGSKPI